MKNHNRRSSYSRRALLAGAAAAAACTSLPAAEAQRPKRYGPNDRVNVAMIGAGGKGAGNAMALLSQNIVAAADVDFDRVARGFNDRNGTLRPDRMEIKTAYDKTARFTDYRRMFDSRKDIDAVVIATPDHHHIHATRIAMERGIHVFVQKPLTTTVREARMMLQGVCGIIRGAHDLHLKRAQDALRGPIAVLKPLLRAIPNAAGGRRREQFVDVEVAL